MEYELKQYEEMLNKMQDMLVEKDKILTKLEYIYNDTNTDVTIGDFFHGEFGEEYSAKQINFEIERLERDYKILKRKLSIFIKNRNKSNGVLELVNQINIEKIKMFIESSESQIDRIKKLVK